MHQMQEMKFTVQLGLDMLANELESIQNLYNFSCTSEVFFDDFSVTIDQIGFFIC